MNTQKLFSLDRPAVAGMFLMAVPVAFWIALAFEGLFHAPVLMNSFFITIDNISPVLTVLLLVVLPAIALLWNFFHIIGFRFAMNDGELNVNVNVKTKLINIGVIVSAVINIGLITLYAVSEFITFSIG